jgi:hypothetical protein
MSNVYAENVNEVQSSSAVNTRFTASTSTTALNPDGNRVMFTVYNEGPADLYLKCSSDAVTTTNYDFIVPQGFYLECDWYTGQVNAIFSAAGSAANITEYK